MGSKRRSLDLLLARMRAFCEASRDHALAALVQRVAAITEEWSSLTDEVMQRAEQDAGAPMSAAFEYMEYSGYACLAWCWARMAVVAHDASQQPDSDKAFLQAKIDTAHFYMERILPRTLALRESMLAPTASLQALDDEQFFMP
jgi:hypothetical protein